MVKVWKGELTEFLERILLKKASSGAKFGRWSDILDLFG